jgi:methyltransferase family protein
MLPAVVTDALASGDALRPDGTVTPLRANVTERDAQRLYDLVRTIRPCVTVELGLGQGISALAIAQALTDNGRGVHHVIDPYEHAKWDDVGLANIRRANLDERITFYDVFPEHVIPTMPRVEFAFMDGSHLFDLVLLDFVLVDKQLEVGGVIGVHDLWMRSIQKVLRYILANRHYRIYDDVPSRPKSEPSPRTKRLSRLAHRVPRASCANRGGCPWRHGVVDPSLR